MRLESLEDRRLLSLSNFGPADPIDGFPMWFEDTNGVRVELMPFFQGEAPFDNGQPLVPDPLSIAAPPEAGNAFSERIGFGEEAFWWAAEAAMDVPAGGALPIGGGALLVLAQEAAFVNAVADGDQFAFGRIRIRVDAPFDGTYTVTHPYGEVVFENVIAGPTGINSTIDVGDVPPFANRAALTTDNPIGPFLVATNAPAGHLGDPAVESTVTGSPTGNNFFSITGPFDGLGTSVTLTTDLFSVAGRLFPGEPPFVAQPIADVIVPVDAPPAVIDVSAVFDDPDFNTLNGDVLTLSVTSDNPALVAASLDVTQTQLTLTYAAGLSGTANVSVTATDQAGLTATDTFTATISPFFNPPTVANPVADVIADEDAVPVVIDLGAVFNDPDTVSNGDVLTLSATSDNSALVSASMTGTQLTLTFQANANGAATVNVTATDLAGQSVTDTFLVTVNSINDSPTVVQPIADVTLGVTAPPLEIDLAAVFGDVDIATNGDQLTFSAVSDNLAAVTATVTGTLLTLQSNSPGAANVTVTATDSLGLSAQTGVSVQVGVEHVVQLPAGGFANVALVSNVNGNLRVMNRGRMLLNAPLAEAASLTILGGDNKADKVTLDLGAGGGFALAGGIVFDGGAGRGMDALTIRGTPGDDTFTLGAQGVTLGDFQIPFTGVEHLWLDGRAGNDIYAIQDLPVSTTIRDARGIDTLDFSGAATGVNVNLGRAAPQRIFGGTTSLKLQSAVTIENVIGTPFNDVLRGGARSSLLVGGDGDDTLAAGRGRSVLIGGLGVDNLRGRASSDLLIGGSTTFDADQAALLAVLAEWSARLSLDARVTNLTDGIGPALTPGVSVLDDGAADTLFGGPAGDWFLSFASDNVLDQGPGDRPV